MHKRARANVKSVWEALYIHVINSGMKSLGETSVSVNLNV